MVAAAVIGGGALLSAGTSLIGSSQASSAAKNAANLQAQTQAQNVARTQPFVDTGASAASQLQGLNTSGFTAGQPNYLASAVQPGAMTEANLIATPGYQFNLGQGLQATQNSAAARGLGVSGAAMKGAATFATGLADSTYQKQFNNQQTQFQNNLNLNTAQQGNTMNLYNRLAGTATIGANAASGVGSTGANAANAAGGYLSAAGQYSAAGTAGVGSAATGAAQNYLQSNALASYLAAQTPTQAALTVGGATTASGAAP